MRASKRDDFVQRYYCSIGLIRLNELTQVPKSTDRIILKLTSKPRFDRLFILDNELPISVIGAVQGY